jgi:hypothetical protein
MGVNSSPSLLKPTEIELFIFNDKTVEVPKAILTFKKWQGLPIANTFGGKPLVDFDGKPMFVELAIMKLFKISGWQARWIETYGANVKTPFHFSDWSDSKLSEQPVDQIQDNNILKTFNEISLLNGVNYFSGCWDILGWFEDQIVFAECKRTKKDKLRNTQYNWLSACILYGLKPDNFLVIQWDFID